jgi:outer membrane lipoprotein-sorting protein
VGLTFALFLAFVPLAAVAQSEVQAPEIPVEEIIRRFSEKEKEFRVARENYSYRQEVKVQELTDSDRVRGEYQTVTEVAFDDKGRRTEKLVYAPPDTLQNISITAEDLEDIRSIQPFVLTSDDIHLYDLKYGGRETLDELDTYVFDVSPKKIERGQRYFEGRIWVDDRDFQIVKTYGKSVPDLRPKNGNENLFPKFETYREQIDDYWFPTYTRAVDTLQFSSGPQKIREIIRYGDYKRFQASVKLRFGGEVTENSTGPSNTSGDDVTAPALDPKYKDDSKDQKK